MSKNLYMHAEFLAKVNLQEKTLKEWERVQIIEPVGFTDEKISLYSEKSIEEVSNIRKLLELGYQLEEIQKIVKKVGMPKTDKNKEHKEGMNKYLTVGHLAEQAGVSSRTIKHWEDKGIIQPDTRSDGGFRLYSEIYVYLCKLIKDLQLFGYTLNEIKVISNDFKELTDLKEDMNKYSGNVISKKLNTMNVEIQRFFDKIKLFKEGIQRWEELLKKQRKEVKNLENQNKKRLEK